MAETEAPKLLPCPFCGGGPTIHKHFNEALWRLIHRCRVMGPMIIDWRSDEAALASIWNTRADLAAAEREGLREALAEADAYIQGGLPDTEWSRVERESCRRYHAARAALGGGG